MKQANSAGGINGKQIELVVYDDQASPKEAVPIANRLIEKDGVKVAVSGSYSGSTRAAAGIFQDAGIPYISAYAIHPDITRAGNYVFRHLLHGGGSRTCWSLTYWTNDAAQTCCCYHPQERLWKIARRWL